MARKNQWERRWQGVVELVDLEPVIYWCFYSEGQCYVHTPDENILCKDVWEAGRILLDLRESLLLLRLR